MKNASITKLAICGVVGLVGLSLIMAKPSVLILAIGFLITAGAVACGHYYWARLNQAKNPTADEIEKILSEDKIKKGRL